ncbi:tegument protein TRS1 [Cercopithecine betaherpesvirus 5]|uniref:Tegument protein TRS1 n=1 Tax=Simian cytomegalovirus (strain Colburn) TaxID=50292 RepID=G8XTP3_SCMVC|nr:tegument protein TRS1 [Cercopithecine betaherpesvirus 5]AEV80535.1 tegument protein TRS1 [Cercopithecine betaherpesvirus 5]
MTGRRPPRPWSAHHAHHTQHARYAGLRNSPPPNSPLLPTPPRHWHPLPPFRPPAMQMSSLAAALPVLDASGHPIQPPTPPNAPGAPPARELCTLPQRHLLAQIPAQRRALSRDEFLVMATCWSGAFMANTTARATRKWCQRETGQLLPLGRPAGFYAVITPRSEMRDVGATDLRQLSPTDDWIVLIACIVHETTAGPGSQPTICRHEGLYLALGPHFRVFLLDFPRMTLHLVATDADEFWRYGCGDIPRLYLCTMLPPLTTHPPHVTELLSRQYPNPSAAAAAISHGAAGQTVHLQTPGRAPQPWLVTTSWDELERWEPFCHWPCPTAIVAAVRSFIGDRLCCNFHLLGYVTTSHWLTSLTEWAAARNNYFETRSRNPRVRGPPGTETAGDTATVKRRPKTKGRHRGPPHAQPQPDAPKHEPSRDTPHDPQSEVDEEGRLLVKNPMVTVLIILDDLGSVFGYCTQDGLLYPLADDLFHFQRVGLLGLFNLGRTVASAEQTAARILSDRDAAVWERPRADALYLWPRTGGGAAGGPRDLPSQLAFLTRATRWSSITCADSDKAGAATDTEDDLRARDAQALGLPPNAGCNAPLSDLAQLSRALRFDWRYWRLASGPEEYEDPGEDDYFNELPYRTWAPTDYNPQWDPQTAFGPNTTVARRLSHHRARAGRPLRRPLPVQPADRGRGHFPLYSSDGVLVIPC